MGRRLDENCLLGGKFGMFVIRRSLVDLKLELDNTNAQQLDIENRFGCKIIPCVCVWECET